MPELKRCDFCDRLESELPEIASGADKLILDADGLWVCRACQSKLVTKPAEQPSPDFLEDALLALVGYSAGALCRTLALPYTPPYKNVLDAASTIAYDEDRYMSTWIFVSEWLDGTTVWQNPDNLSKAIVTVDGTIQILDM